MHELTTKGRAVLEAARAVIRSNYDHAKQRHTVGAAVLCGSGKIYAAVNLYANCGFGPCAELVLLGSAISAGEREFLLFAAAGGEDRGYAVLAPCGNCRQVLLEYAPNAEMVMDDGGSSGLMRVADLLPRSYVMI